MRPKAVQRGSDTNYLRLGSVQFDIDAQKFYNIFTDLITKSPQK